MSSIPNFYRAKSGRVYVEVGDVATITGLKSMDLDFKYRPHAWASPRDFLWLHGRLWCAVLSLPQMVDALFDAGQGDAAILLRTAVEGWIVQLAEEYQPVGKFSNPGGKAAPASESWLARWEAQHDA
jgi:hypothetical protein